MTKQELWEAYEEAKAPLWEAYEEALAKLEDESKGE